MVYCFQPPRPPIAPLRMPYWGWGSEGILKGKLISFLKSAPLKTLELIYYMIFVFFSIFAVTAAAAVNAAHRPPPKSILHLEYVLRTHQINFVVFVSIPVAPLSSLEAALVWVLGYPKNKNHLIFEISIIEKPRIDTSHYLLWYIGLSPPSPLLLPPDAPLGGLSLS